MGNQIRNLAAAAAVVLVVSACGGGGEEGAGGVESAADLAEAIGCEGYTADSEELFVQEGGSCTTSDGDVGVYYFAGQDERDSYVETAQAFGGLYLVGDSWVVSGDREALEAAQAEVGGDVK